MKKDVLDRYCHDPLVSTRLFDRPAKSVRQLMSWVMGCFPFVAVGSTWGELPKPKVKSGKLLHQAANGWRFYIVCITLFAWIEWNGFEEMRDDSCLKSICRSIFYIHWNDCPTSCGTKRRTRDLVNLLESPTEKNAIAPVETWFP